MWVGRTNVVKMSVLPSVIMESIKTPVAFFTEIEETILTFCMKPQRALIPKVILKTRMKLEASYFLISNYIFLAVVIKTVCCCHGDGHLGQQQHEGPGANPVPCGPFPTKGPGRHRGRSPAVEGKPHGHVDEWSGLRPAPRAESTQRARPDSSTGRRRGRAPPWGPGDAAESHLAKETDEVQRRPAYLTRGQHLKRCRKSSCN